mmetsp:Transcript_35527/g.84294  ORF Transcript_35527/g.84294 Transcript_35527/m.84294 type:complete len:331 (+) Transcript_35527:1121-2113(+)
MQADHRRTRRAQERHRPALQPRALRRRQRLRRALPPRLRLHVRPRLHRGGRRLPALRGPQQLLPVLLQIPGVQRAARGEPRRRNRPRGTSRPAPRPRDPRKLQELRGTRQRPRVNARERGLLPQHVRDDQARGRDRVWDGVPGACERGLRRRGPPDAARHERHPRVCPVSHVQGRGHTTLGGACHRKLRPRLPRPQKGPRERSDGPSGTAAPGQGRERQGRDRAAPRRDPGHWQVRLGPCVGRGALRHRRSFPAAVAHGHALEAARAGRRGCRRALAPEKPEREAVAARGAGLRGHDLGWLVRHGRGPPVHLPRQSGDGGGQHEQGSAAS